MSFLDLAARDQQVAQGPQPGEQPRLPAGFGESFEAAWDENQLFGQSVASGNASMRALSDYVDEVKLRTGRDITPDLAAPVSPDPAYAGIGDTPTAAWQRANDAATKLGLPPLSDDEIGERAAAISRAARQRAAEVGAAEHSGAGLFLGGAAGAVTDPVNLVAAPLTGGEGTLLVQALRLGGIAALTQAANEAVGAPFREQVQPGYLTSGEPVANIATAFGQGAALHLGSAALGALWRGVKTRVWPTSVRDAGNIVESEANVQGTNVYPGVAGEAAHREALTAAIDQVAKGEPVAVSVPPDLEAQAGIIAYHGSPHSFEAFSDDAIGTGEGAQAYGRGHYMAGSEQTGEFYRPATGNLYRVNIHANQDHFLDWDKPLSEQSAYVQESIFKKLWEISPGLAQKVRHADYDPSQIISELSSELSPSEYYRNAVQGSGTLGTRAASDTLRQAGIPGIKYFDEGSRAVGEGSRNYVVFDPRSIEITHKNGQPISRLEAVRQQAATAAEAAQAARAAAAGESAPELPFEATAAEQRASEAALPLQDAIRAIAARGGQILDQAEVTAIADRLTKMAPDEAADAVRQIQVAPHQMAEAPVRAPKEAEPVPLAPKQPAEVLGTPDHEAALRADLDRARMTGDVRIPAGVDERGEPVFRSLDAALDEVDGFREAADQIQACAAPQPAEAEPA